MRRVCYDLQRTRQRSKTKKKREGKSPRSRRKPSYLPRTRRRHKKTLESRIGRPDAIALAELECLRTLPRLTNARATSACLPADS